MKYKILVVTGTRAEYGLLKPTLKRIQAHPSLQLQLLVTGMHTLKKYGNTISEIIKDDFKISHTVKISETDNMLNSLITEISGIKKYMISAKPDLLLILGDRHEAFAAATAAAYQNIPIAHIHGGDISGNVTIDDKVRDAITSLSDLHFPVTKSSAYRIKSILGHKANNIITINNFAFENIKNNLLTKNKLASEFNLNIDKPWFLVIMHPSPLEKISATKQITSLLDALKDINVEIIGIYPNSDTGGKEFIKQIQKRKIFTKFYSSLKRNIYLSLLANVNLLIGNSSSSILEAPFFLTPVINIGERQKNRRKYKYLFEVDFNSKNILNIINKTINIKNKCNIQKKGNYHVSQLIVNKIFKYLSNKYE